MVFLIYKRILNMYGKLLLNVNFVLCKLLHLKTSTKKYKSMVILFKITLFMTNAIHSQ